MGPVQTTVGIELTDSALRVAVVQLRFGKARFLRSDSIEGFAELSMEARKNAVTALIGKLKLRRIPAFLTVPREMGICGQLELPVEVGDRVNSAVELQIESLAPWSSDEVYWGYSAGRPGKNDKTIKVSVAIVPRAVLEPILEVFRSAGLPLSGAGLSGMAEAHASGINLIPFAERYRRNPLQVVPTYVLAGLLVLLGIVAVFRAPYQWHLYGATLDSEIEALRPGVAEVLAQEEKLNQATVAYLALQARVADRDSNLEALLELARVLPSDCWISSYSSQGGSVTLSGFAQSASVVQRVLEESPVFADVQFSSPVTRDAAGRDRFSVKASFGVPQ